MDAVHLHLIVNHVPIIVTILSMILLTWAIISDKADYRNLAYIGFIIAAVFAVAAFQSGENAEDIVENLSWFDHDILENHEHAAETARWFVLILGVMGISGLTYFKDTQKKGFKIFLYATLILSIAVAAYLIYTGYLGGMIRHSELSML